MSLVQMSQTKNKLTYALFEDAPFKRALSKIANFPFKNVKTAFAVAKLVRKWNEALKIAQEDWLVVLKAHAQIDEKGNFVPVEVMNPDGTTTKDHNRFTIPDEKKDAFQADKKIFEAQEFEVPCSLLSMADLQDCQLTAQELLSLEPVLDTSTFSSSSPTSSSDVASAPSSSEVA